jgi:hypothetical protein
MTSMGDRQQLVSRSPQGQSPPLGPSDNGRGMTAPCPPYGPSIGHEMLPVQSNPSARVLAPDHPGTWTMCAHVVVAVAGRAEGGGGRCEGDRVPRAEFLRKRQHTPRPAN